MRASRNAQAIAIAKKRNAAVRSSFDAQFGPYRRCALVLFYNYGLDVGTVWKSTPDHEPIIP